MTAIITAIVVWAVVFAGATVLTFAGLVWVFRRGTAPATPGGTKEAPFPPGERIDTPVPARPGGGR